MWSLYEPTLVKKVTIPGIFRQCELCYHQYIKNATTWRALQACYNYWSIAVRRTAILCTDKKTYSIAVNVCNPSLSNDCGIGDVYGTFTKSIGVSLLALGILVDWFSFQCLDGSRSSTHTHTHTNNFTMACKWNLHFHVTLFYCSINCC